MRDLILWDMLSLDGLFEGPDNDLGWFRFDDDLEEYILDSQRAADTILFGRRTYEGMASHWQSEEGEIADFMNSVPKVVFSRTLERVTWNNSRLVSDDVPGEVARLKQQAGGDMFVFGSADFSATLIEHGLADEYRIGLNPVILGEGTPFFKGRSKQLPLTLVDVKPFSSGLVILHYRPE